MTPSPTGSVPLLSFSDSKGTWIALVVVLRPLRVAMATGAKRILQDQRDRSCPAQGWSLEIPFRPVPCVLLTSLHVMQRLRREGRTKGVLRFPAKLGLSFDCMKLCFSLDSLGKGCRLRFIL